MIDDAEYKRVRDSFQNLWLDPGGDPTAVYIGCPHNTYKEMVYWSQNLTDALKDAGQEKFAIPVVMASAPRGEGQAAGPASLDVSGHDACRRPVHDHLHARVPGV